MQINKQIKLSQNFLKSRPLIRNLLINRTSIEKGDLVLDIGAGKGIISDELFHIGAKVRAIEYDSKLFALLKKKFGNQTNIELFFEDILHHQLPNSEYKVFSNIPFAIEGLIVRKLIDDINPPIDSYLVVQKELAERLGGFLGNNQFNISHLPFFEFSIEHKFKRTDFVPNALVDCVLFRIVKRTNPLVNWKQRVKFDSFIKHGYGNGLAVYKNLSNNYNIRIIQDAFSRHSISRKLKPSHLDINVWIKLFEYTNNPPKK